MMTYSNTADIEVLQDNAESMTYMEFLGWVLTNCYYRESGKNLIDFDYGSVTATIDRARKTLVGCFDCWDNEGQWITVYHCDNISLR